MQPSRILLVEGVSDQYFFFEMLRAVGVSAHVKVTAPKDHGDRYNNKGGVLNTLPLLVRQMNDGRLERVAAIVDADHDSNNGMGYRKTLDEVSAILEREGFTRRERIGDHGGFTFKHNDGLNPIGLWIMPDNASNGGIEEWVIESANGSERTALDYAKSVLLRVPGGVKYAETHSFKAQASAWMAWQRIPGQGLQQAVKQELLDLAKPLPSRLLAWLKAIFP